MQSRYRSSGDGFRSGNGNRNSNLGGGFGRPQPKAYPSPQPQAPPRKADIFMEAGRLAAEYLVSKGSLPADSLPPKWPPQGRFREPPVPLEGRTSALARLGDPAPEPGRRLYDDEFDHLKSRSRERRRNGPYSRGSRSEWGSRDEGRRGVWRDRGRGYSDAMGEGDDEFVRGYHRGTPRGGFDEAGSSVSRVGSDRHSKSEATGESGTEVDAREMAEDTASKASSTSTRKDTLADADADGNKAGDDAKVSSLEAGDEAKSGDSKETVELQVEDMDDQPCADEGEPMYSTNDDLLKSCAFAKVPTKPRSSAALRSPKADQGTEAEVGNISEVATAEVTELVEGEKPVKGLSSESCREQNDEPQYQAPDDTSTQRTDEAQYQTPDDTSTLKVDLPMEEPVESQDEATDCPPGFGTSGMQVDASQEGRLAQHIDKMEGTEAQRDLSPSSLSVENENTLQVLGTKQSSPCIEIISTDEKMVEAVDQEKHVGEDAVLILKVEPEISIKLEEEKQLPTTSFDLNLMGTPEITEIPDGPMLGHLQTSGAILENGNELSAEVDLSIGNNTDVADGYGRFSVGDKEIPIINLEDDSPMDDNACDSSKLKNETMYSSLDNFLSRAAQEDLDDIQDGYSIGFPEFLGTDISGCSSVPGDLNNMQTDTGLHDAQGVPGDDDSIYVSLGEIPIGFMGVWDQPPQEYGKFF